MTKLSTLVLAASLSFTGYSFAEVTGKEVTYSTDDTEMNGYLAYDSSIEGERPIVIVVHEWWGHTDYVRKRADMLAEMGYLAFALDMYGEGKTADHPKDAGAFAGAVMSNMDEAGVDRFKAAVEFAQSQPQADKDEVAAIGYCFGGAVVLHMARVGLDLDAVASFHGSLAGKAVAKEGEVKARVLVCNGAADPMVSEDAITDFQQEMNDAGVDYEFINYEGAKHGFTNPEATANGEKFNIPLAYDKEADEKSWAELKKLLSTVFQS